MKKKNRLIGIVLSLVLVLGMLPVTVSAATADETPQSFSFEVDKSVVKGGDATPGEETFTFELEYGTVEENDQHVVVFTPDEDVTLADCGIAFTNNTITTNGEGEQTFTLGGTIDPTKVTAENHWQSSSGNDSVPKWIITLRLTEKNDGKTGWTYSEAERYLTITVIGNEISTDVHILGNDVSDNNFENIYTAAAPAAPAEQNKPIDSPPTGDSADMGLWFALMLAAAVCTGGTVLYSERSRSER